MKAPRLKSLANRKRRQPNLFLNPLSNKVILLRLQYILCQMPLHQKKDKQSLNQQLANRMWKR
jgi:hypothetical protein